MTGVNRSLTISHQIASVLQWLRPNPARRAPGSSATLQQMISRNDDNGRADRRARFRAAAKATDRHTAPAGGNDRAPRNCDAHRIAYCCCSGGVDGQQASRPRRYTRKDSRPHAGAAVLGDQSAAKRHATARSPPGKVKQRTLPVRRPLM